MNTFHRFWIGFTVVATLIGCLQKNVFNDPSEALHKRGKEFDGLFEPQL